MTEPLIKVSRSRTSRCLRYAEWSVMTSTDSSSARSQEMYSSEGRRHSGLSALILAATSQLGHYFDPNDDSHPSSNESPELQPTAISGLSGYSEAFEACYNEPKRFPELLMSLASDRRNVDVITFLPDGKFFAIRTHDFSESIMHHHFAISTFEEFLELSSDWGFRRFSELDCDIQVFRHPLFRLGDWDKCSQITLGESPTDARVSALTDRVRLELAAEQLSSGISVSKRRLSPDSFARMSGESLNTSQRFKMNEDEAEYIKAVKLDSECDDSLSVSHTTPDETHPDCAKSFSSSSRHDELRSIALAITTNELRLTNSGSDCTSGPSSSPSQQHRSLLVDSAVESATHTIVTDAIESLLRDKQHTQNTYLKHEEELSRSSLPGVVPLSKQLFSPAPAVPTDNAYSTIMLSLATSTVTDRGASNPPAS